MIFSHVLGAILIHRLSSLFLHFCFSFTSEKNPKITLGSICLLNSFVLLPLT